jgi:hypothetical protein
MGEGNCCLCGHKSKLKLSHILPAFIFRWMKETSATGFLRSGRNPNRRDQDGEKRYWLCGDCESLFNQWETVFADQIFHPLVAKGPQRFQYEDWMLKFCVSVSWRVLSMFVEDSLLSRLGERQQAVVPLALQKWSEFLLGKTPHPEVFEQHFFLCLPVSSHAISDMPSNINRYLFRVSDINVAASKNSLIVYSKFAQMILIGFIDVEIPKNWIGTKVHVQSGCISNDITVPREVLDFIISQCNQLADQKRKISEIQQVMIEESFRKNSDRVIKSESFHALYQDVKLFGTDKVFGPAKGDK